MLDTTDGDQDAPDTGSAESGQPDEPLLRPGEPEGTRYEEAIGSEAPVEGWQHCQTRTLDRCSPVEATLLAVPPPVAFRPIRELQPRTFDGRAVRMNIR